MSELLPNKPRGPEGHPEDSEEHLSQCFRSKRLSPSLHGQHINATPTGWVQMQLIKSWTKLDHTPAVWASSDAAKSVAFTS